MKTLKTKVICYQKGNRIEVDSPYWRDNYKRKSCAMKLADFAIIILALLTLIAIFYS